MGRPVPTSEPIAGSETPADRWREGYPPGRFRFLAILIRHAVNQRSEMRSSGGLAWLRHVCIHPVMWARWAFAGLSGANVPVYRTRIALLHAAAIGAPNGGRWLEFGVHEGVSINHLAQLTTAKVWGFDSFEGLPGDWTRSLRKGLFTTGGRLPEVAGNVVLVKGWFSETLPRFVAEEDGFFASLLHVDCDLYQSAREVLLGLKDHLREGSVIVFDEFQVGVLPDDEARAFRDFLRATGLRFRYIGCSLSGSVAVRLGAVAVGPGAAEGPAADPAARGP
jgi:hypothetical protein